MFGIGTSELILILIVAVLLFGPRKIPELAQTLGKTVAKFRQATDDLKKNLEDEIGMDDLRDLHPRRIADKIISKELIDIRPGDYHTRSAISDKDPYTEEAEKVEETIKANEDIKNDKTETGVKNK